MHSPILNVFYLFTSLVFPQSFFLVFTVSTTLVLTLSEPLSVHSLAFPLSTLFPSHVSTLYSPRCLSLGAPSSPSTPTPAVIKQAGVYSPLPPFSFFDILFSLFSSFFYLFFYHHVSISTFLLLISSLILHCFYRYTFYYVLFSLSFSFSLRIVFLSSFFCFGLSSLLFFAFYNAFILMLSLLSSFSFLFLHILLLSLCYFLPNCLVSHFIVLFSFLFFLLIFRFFAHLRPECGVLRRRSLQSKFSQVCNYNEVNGLYNARLGSRAGAASAACRGGGPRGSWEKWLAKGVSRENWSLFLEYRAP